MVHPSVRVGSVEVVPLCDGWAALPLADELPGHAVDWAAERDAFPWAFADGDAGSWAWHVHAFLLRSRGGAILVDSGIGHHGSPPYDVTGRIDDELRSAAVAPGDVRHVIHTHLHSDHAGGACRPGDHGSRTSTESCRASTSTRSRISGASSSDTPALRRMSAMLSGSAFGNGSW